MAEICKETKRAREFVHTGGYATGKSAVDRDTTRQRERERTRERERRTRRWERNPRVG